MVLTRLGATVVVVGMLAVVGFVGWLAERI